MAKSDLIHVHVEGNVFEGKSDELAKFLENGGRTVDSQGNADLWQWSISSDNKLIINEIFRSNEAWLGHIQGFFQPNGDEIFKMCGFERVQVCGPVSDEMKEMAKKKCLSHLNCMTIFMMGVLANLNRDFWMLCDSVIQKYGFINLSKVSGD